MQTPSIHHPSLKYDHSILTYYVVAQGVAHIIYNLWNPNCLLCSWSPYICIIHNSQQMSSLSCATVLNTWYRFCKVPPQLCDGSTIILTFSVVAVV